MRELIKQFENERTADFTAGRAGFEFLLVKSLPVVSLRPHQTLSRLRWNRKVPVVRGQGEARPGFLIW